MNREIEFRAWVTDYDTESDKIIGKMIYQDCDFKSLLNSYKPNDFRIEVFEAFKVFFMQYTGLKDRNGVKIFEGDLCQYFKNDLLLVEWHQTDAQFKLKRLNGDKEYLRFDCDVEVIGNTFENPELLGERGRE